MWTALTSTIDTGADTILSYRLDMDSGSGWNDLVGFSSDDDSTSYIKTGLTAGTTYSFRVVAKNSFGWGTYSNVVAIIPSAIPSTMAAVTTTNSNALVKIEWTDPVTNGAAITAYQILIQ